MIPTTTRRKVLIKPSPLLTDTLLAIHAPAAFPIASTKPTDQFTLSFNMKTTKADSV